MSDPTCTQCGKQKKQGPRTEHKSAVEQEYEKSSGIITILDDSKKWDSDIQEKNIQILIGRRHVSATLVIGAHVPDKELERILRLSDVFAAIRLCDQPRESLPADVWTKVESLQLRLTQWNAADLHTLSKSKDVSNGLFFSELEQLDISGCSSVTSLPDLSMFPKLQELDVHDTGVTTLSISSRECPRRVCFSLHKDFADLQIYLPKHVVPNVQELQIYHDVKRSGSAIKLKGLDKLSESVSLHLTAKRAVPLSEATVASMRAKVIKNLSLTGISLDKDTIEALASTRVSERFKLERCALNAVVNAVVDTDLWPGENENDYVGADTVSLLGSKMRSKILEFVDCKFITNEFLTQMWSREPNPGVVQLKLWGCPATKMPDFSRNMPNLLHLALSPVVFDDNGNLLSQLKSIQNLRTLSLERLTGDKCQDQLLELAPKLRGLSMSTKSKCTDPSFVQSKLLPLLGADFRPTEPPPLLYLRGVEGWTTQQRDTLLKSTTDVRVYFDPPKRA